MTHYSEEILIDYIHGEVSATEDARIHAHMEACEPCRATFDAQAAIGDLLRASARENEREFPSTIKARVWEAVRNERPSLADRLRGLLQPAIAVPIVALLAVAAYLGVPSVHELGSHGPTVAAAFYLEEHAAEGQDNPLADRTNVNATFATDRAAAPTAIPLIDAADAATLPDSIDSGI